MTKSASRFFALSFLTLAVTASCDRATDATTPSVPPVVTGVELIARPTLPPGATLQFRLVARRSDGTSEDITASARFYSWTPSVLAVLPDGIATAVKV